MAEVLFSWGIIGLSTVLFGSFITHYFFRQTDKLHCFDVYIICGLIFETLYAELFSLIYKVGVMADFLLTMLGVVVLIFMIARFGKQIRCKLKNIHYWSIFTIILIVVMTAGWTVLYPHNYDTDLYHAQAIRWIEEYGIVPGLGNLHNRLAYNSSFLPLQALFSLKWLFGRSLHSVNGFICAFFLSYAVLTCNIWKNRKLNTTDLFRCMIIFFIMTNTVQNISSPGTDLAPLLIILYICVKWTEFSIESAKSECYCYVAMVAVYCVTLKLSAATFVLLAAYPVYRIIHSGKWLILFKYIVTGVVIVLPYLIRNVIISGYLLYPYPQIDLFHVDWKMPGDLLTIDSREIMAWGRNIHDVKLYNEPFLKWFPSWLQVQQPMYRVLFICGTLFLIFGIGLIVRDFIKKEANEECVLLLICIISAITWFCTAPLMRYGSIYLLLSPCIILGKWLSKLDKMEEEKNPLISAGMILLLFYGGHISYMSEIDWIQQQDYLNYPTEKIIWQGTEMWTSTNTKFTGYAPFPCATYSGILNYIEMRGEDLSEGFRMKPEYSDLTYEGYLNIWANR